MDALDFVDLFILIGAKLLEQTDAYLNFVTHPTFQVAKELILVIVELILVIESTSSYGGKQGCFIDCVGDEGYAKCTDDIAQICLEKCDLNNSQCELWDVYSGMWIASVLIRMVVLALIFFPFLAFTCLRTRYNKNDPWMRYVFHWFINIWATIFGLMALIAALISISAGNTADSTFVFLVFQILEIICTFGSIGYSIWRCSHPAKDSKNQPVEELKSPTAT